MLITILGMINLRTSSAQICRFRLIADWKYGLCSRSYLVGQGYRFKIYSDLIYCKYVQILKVRMPDSNHTDSLVPNAYDGREQAYIKHRLLEAYLQKLFLLLLAWLPRRLAMLNFAT